MPNANVDLCRHQSHFPAAVVYQHNLYRVAKKAFAEKNITTILISCMLAKTLNTKMKTFWLKDRGEFFLGYWQLQRNTSPSKKLILYFNNTIEDNVKSGCPLADLTSG